MNVMRWLGLGALVVSVGYGAVGCAERDPINKVQANALSKHFFAGPSLSDTTDDPEFYMRNTVIDVPFGAAQDGLFTASYAQPVTRVKWQITENALIARETYEHVTDSDHQGARTSNTGQVVAMFKIESQFDVRRSYNPQTGEELNIIEENSSDRPWYEREYLRVDWSSNMVTDGYEVDTLSQIGLFGAIKWDPMSYYDSDPNSPNAPVVNEAEGYFDVTSKAFATPQTFDTPYGTFPACWFSTGEGGSYPYGNCNATEVTLRLSFRHVTDNDYQAEDWDGTKQDAFGSFTQDRFGYERNYGVLDQKWHRFASRYNLWDRSHIDGTQCAVDFWRDANGNVQKYSFNGSDFARDANGLPVPDANGQPYPGGQVGIDVHQSSDGKTEDLCVFTKADGTVAHEGSQCDEFANKCTLPLRERKIHTIPWYYGPTAPADLFPSTAFALNSWNVAMKRAAILGMRADALRVGDTDTASKFEYALDEDVTKRLMMNPMPADADLDAWKSAPYATTNIFVLCHNPVIVSDDPACGPEGRVARLGDIRYNMVNIIQNPQNPSPWGIMVDADDPLTGEKVSTSVNEWGHVLDLASQNAVDLIKWFNGELSDADITGGTYMKYWQQASGFGSKQYQPATLSAEEIGSRINSIDTSLSKLNGLTAADDKLPREIRTEKAAKNLQATMGPSIDSKLEAARQALIGTKFEVDLLSPEQLQVAGFDPQTKAAGDDKTIAKASPLRGMNPALRRWTDRMRNVTMAKHGACVVEQPEPSAVAGLARQAAQLYPRPDTKDPNYPALLVARDKQMHQWIREQFHISVIEHEMGHSMGLRHNFTSNWDALNYHKQYWQLRTRNGAEHYCVGTNPTQNGYKNPTDPLDATTPRTDGSVCVGPRWIDPLTDTEVNGLIWRWGATTVMDYPGDITQDMNDLGAYDKAFVRFVYGGLVDVDTDTDFNKAARDGGQTPATARGKAVAYLQSLDGFGGIGGSTVAGLHYSQYADHFNLLGTCSGATDPKDPLSAKCSGPPMEYVARRDMRTVSKYGDIYLSVRPDLVSNFAVACGASVDKMGTACAVPTELQGKVRHPYMFGSDEFADIGNVPVYRFDSGADPYEQVQFVTSVYENRYVFDNFRRNRIGFNTHAVNNRIQSRYLDKLQQMTKTLGLLVEIYSNATQQLKDPGGLMPLALGSADTLSTFIRILTRPEPGSYATTQNTVMPLAGAQDLVGQLNNPKGEFVVALGSGQGRFLHNDYDYSQGYYWADYQLFAGTNLEKRAVVGYLLEGYNNFISNSKEDYIDGRYKNLNFASLYPNQVRRILSAVMQGDGLTLGPYITAGTPGQVSQIKFLPWDKYDNSTLNIDYPAGATVLDPLIGWEQQMPGIEDALRFGPTVLTNEYVDQFIVWTPNGVEGQSVAISDQIRFHDPVSGTIYAARTYGTEITNSKIGPVQKAMGARMIEWANTLAARAYNANGTVSDTDGFTYPKYDIANPKDFTAATQLKNFTANLDWTRELHGHMKLNGIFGN